MHMRQTEDFMRDREGASMVYGPEKKPLLENGRSEFPLRKNWRMTFHSRHLYHQLYFFIVFFLVLLGGIWA